MQTREVGNGELLIILIPLAILILAVLSGAIYFAVYIIKMIIRKIPDNKTEEIKNESEVTVRAKVIEKYPTPRRDDYAKLKNKGKKSPWEVSWELGWEYHKNADRKFDANACYNVVFRTEDNKFIDLVTPKDIYEKLNMEDEGRLTYKGKMLLKFIIC